MKKIFFLAVLLAFFSSCGADEQDNTAYILYTQAAETFRQVDSILMDSSMLSRIRVIGGDLDGEQLELLAISNVAQIINSPTDVHMRIELNTILDGFSIPMTSYFRNGVYYVDIRGEQFRVPLSLDEVLEQTNASLLEFPQSAIISQIARESANGAELSFTLNGSQLTNLVETVADGILALFGGTIETANLSPNNIEATIRIDENQIPIYTSTAMTMTITHGDTTFLVDITTFVEILQIGDVEIEFPDNLNEFQLLDDLTLADTI
ncbi:MAG: hypothetical protein FWG64_12870 [Firmicutes bacterium]|nr:hypothetical protein [Bacillota bacterium]